MRMRLCRSGETAEDTAFGSRSRKRHAVLVVAGMAVSCGAGAFLLAFQAGPADAAGTVSCVTSGGALEIAASGTASDSLLVTTSGGSYQIEFDGTAACTATTYSDTAYPAVQVTDNGAVPVVFQPGTDNGVDFEGPGISATLDLSGAPAGVVVSVPAGSVTGLSGGGSDSFSGITVFKGSAAGSTDFVAGPGSAVFTGQGSGNELDLSAVAAAPSAPLVVNAGPGPVNGTASGTATVGSTTYVFAGIQDFTGSSDGSTDFVAPAAGGYTFTGQGSGNTLNLSAAPAGATVTLNGDSPASPGVVANLNSGPGGSTSDEFSDITVNQAAQSISFTAPATGTVGGSATLTATGGASGNPVVFSVDPTSGAGVCTVSGTNGTTVNYTAAGNCVIDANQAGNASYAAAPQVTQAITVNQAPAFVVDSPPLTATAGQPYDYTFAASGTPAPAYALASGAPSWLSVDASTGEVTGTPPAGTTSFSYTVTATNVAGEATAGPFAVTVTKASTNANISAVLRCPASMTAGSAATCTLTVANAGPAAASNVTAAIVLPSALSETSCSSGCTRHGNVYTWTQASLGDGASAQFSITVKASRAGLATVLAVAASQSPDHEPLNNISLQLITIKR
jgi:uncharacterized repeat protein (TIGR01451 family)